MKFYSHIYKVKTDKQKAFNYFLKKDYLKKFFSNKEKERIDIISKTNDEIITEGEDLILNIEYDKSITDVTHLPEI